MDREQPGVERMNIGGETDAKNDEKVAVLGWKKKSPAEINKKPHEVCQWGGCYCPPVSNCKILEKNAHSELRDRI